MNRLFGLLLTCSLLMLFCGHGFAETVKLPGNKDRCPVCGMFVAPYPDWVATIVLADGEQLYFDGCKDLFRYYFKNSEDNSEFLDEVKGIYVTDYYRTQLVPVEDVFFVVGSDVYGPMGHELIPIVGKELAETFSRDHGGSAIYQFNQIRPDNLPVD